MLSWLPQITLYVMETNRQQGVNTTPSPHTGQQWES